MAKVLLSEATAAKILDLDYKGLLQICIKYRIEEPDALRLIELIKKGGKREDIKISIVA